MPRFNRHAANRFVSYGRTSSDEQNPQSIQQQFDTIQETLEREGLAWTQVAAYSDEGVSGRLTTSRPQLMAMLSDVVSGRVDCDVLVVDTPDRLGRSEQVPVLRAMFQSYGVTVVDARSRFADPTTSDGQILAFLGDLQGRRENENKSHMVRRGKRASVKHRRWPGGPVPTGYRLHIQGYERRGSKQVPLKILVPDPQTRSFVERSFESADVRGWGASRIAKELNRDAKIPASLKPVYSNTVHTILRNAIYIGRRDWGLHNVEYRNDVRKVELNPVEDWLVVNDFCEPLVAIDRFERVQHMLQNRRGSKEQDPGSTRSRRGQPGRAIKYPLAGLVRCAKCGRAMATSKLKRDKEARFRCGYVASGNCCNRRLVSEPWLLRNVLKLIINRLFDGKEREAGYHGRSVDAELRLPGVRRAGPGRTPPARRTAPPDVGGFAGRA